ncbi:hypothetical protein MMC12_004614 [Toensbergia leucococca]|nr:hypothetical protein [Toensbergia leucococca]
MAKDSEPIDYVTRRQGSSPPGTTAFIGLRLLDPLLQYAILTRNLPVSILPCLFGGTMTPSSATKPPTNTIVLGLTLYQLLILSMSVGSAPKQIIWVLFTSYEIMPLSSAATISLSSTIVNSINSSFSLWSRTAPIPSTDTNASSLLQTPIVITSALLYLTGIFTESISEIQRRSFKSDLANKGIPYSGGLFGLARHINYGGHTLWRSAYALAFGGPVWALGLASWLFFDFSKRTVPVLEEHCQDKASPPRPV